MRGALDVHDHELPRALSEVDDLHLLGDLATRRPKQPGGRVYV